MLLEDRADEIAGLIPIYSERGDVCQVLGQSMDGSIYEWVEDHTAESVRRQLARCYALDLSVQAEHLRRVFHRSPPVPMYFYDCRVFAPFKLRSSLVPQDSTYGYIEHELIKEILPGTSLGQCRLCLTDGRILPVYSQISTARLSFFFASEVKRKYFTPSLAPEQELLQALKVLRAFWFSHPSW